MISKKSVRINAMFEGIRAKLQPKPAIRPNLSLEPAAISYREQLQQQDQKRRASMRKWVKNNPQAHRPIHQEIRAVEGPIGSIQQQVWVDKDGREVRRDVVRERETIGRYLDSQFDQNPSFNSKNPHYRDFITNLASSEGVSPMTDNCRLSICMPAYMEEGNVYRTLQQYTTQTDKNGRELDPDLWEINIIVNRPTGKFPDRTVDEIKRFVTKSNEERVSKGQKPLHINFVDVEFDEQFAGVGTSRKVITDLTMHRSLQRTSQEGSLYIDAEDADCMYVDPRMVINAITKLDNEPHLDAIRALQDRAPELLMQNDFLLIRRRLEDFAINLMSRKINRSPDTNPNYNFRNNRIPTSGANATFTAEALALVGVYRAGINIAEGRIIGERISMLRGDGANSNTEVVGKVGTRMDTSPRRIIAEIMTGQPTYCPEMTDKIREADDLTLLKQIKHLDHITPRNRKQFETLIADYIANKASMAADPTAFTHSMMFWLGFKRNAVNIYGNPVPADYAIDQNGRVYVHNWANLELALHDYKTRHSREREQGERWKHHMTPRGEQATFPARFSLGELFESGSKVKRGDYVLCLDREIGRGWNARVVAGYNRKTHQLLAFKTESKDYLRKIAQRNISAQRVVDGENYVKARVHNPHRSLLLSIGRLERGDEVIKILPAVSVTLEKQVRQSGRLNVTDALNSIEQVLYGIHDLHSAGIGHFDLKPANILFDSEGKTYVSDFDEVVDFGKKDGISTTTNPRVVPPEAMVQPDGTRIYRKSGDIFQIGVNFYFMLTGRYPFDPQNNPTERKKKYREFKGQGLATRKEQRLAYIKYLQNKGPIIPEYVPKELGEIIRKSLMVDADERYQDAGEMLSDIQRVKSLFSRQSEELPLAS